MPKLRPVENRVLVTGATGFIGANLVERLLRDGHIVLAADVRCPDRRLQNAWERAGGQLLVGSCDVSLRSEVRRVVDEFAPTHVLHTAASTAGTLEELQRVNVQGTLNVFEEAAGVKGLLLSSASVYKPAAHPITECDPVWTVSESHVNPYAWSKLEAETHVLRLRSRGQAVAIARVSACFGPWEAANAYRSELSQIDAAVRAARRGCHLLAGGSWALDFTFVKYTVCALLDVLAHVEDYDVWNVSDGSTVTPSGIVDACRNLQSMHSVSQSREFFHVGRIAPARRKPLNVDRLRSASHVPAPSLPEAIARYWEWLDAQEGEALARIQ